MIMHVLGMEHKWVQPVATSRAPNTSCPKGGDAVLYELVVDPNELDIDEEMEDPTTLLKDTMVANPNELDIGDAVVSPSDPHIDEAPNELNVNKDTVDPNELNIDDM
jgi:hypothetical protein